MRVGIGMDAHRFCPERKLFLGGVEIPFDLGLSGHSDADVVLHALMDAMLGACGAGDIGELFPDTDPAFKDASSLDLLGRVLGIVDGKGYRVVNADIVVICEKPRIAPYRALMRERIGRALGVEPGAVCVKGTTTEGMGFTGQGGGAGGVAVVLLEEVEAGGGGGENA